MPPDWTPNLDASDLEHHHPTHTPIGSSQELKAWKPEIQQGLLYAPLEHHMWITIAMISRVMFLLHHKRDIHPKPARWATTG